MLSNTSPDFLTLAEAADYIGVSKDTLRRWDASDRLKSVRRPGSGYRFYRRPDLELVAAALKADRSTSPDCLLTYRVAFSSASDVYLRMQ
jgi:excisionase family DNA binding protein